MKATGYAALEVIVVDNASRDGLVERLSGEHEDVLIVENDENLGYSGGCNVGIHRALERDADLVLLFNSDATATPDMLDEMVGAALGNERIGILGPTILEGSGPTVWYQGGRINRALGYTRHPGMGTTLMQGGGELQATDYVSGCAMLVRREVFERVGLMEEGYFLYLEDAEFSERARKAGFLVLHHPGALAGHEVSASSGIRGTNVMTPLRAYYFARNMVHFIRRHVTGIRRWTALQGQILVRAPYRLLSMPLDGQLGSLGPYMQGLWHGLMGVTGKWEHHDRWAS